MRAHLPSEAPSAPVTQPPGQPEIVEMRPRQLVPLPVRRLVWRQRARGQRARGQRAVAVVAAVDTAAFDPYDFQVLCAVGLVDAVAVVAAGLAHLAVGVAAGPLAHLAVVVVVVVPYCGGSHGGEAVGEGVLPHCCCLGRQGGEQAREQQRQEQQEQHQDRKQN